MILRCRECSGAYEPHLELKARRFMGVLRHPVPLIEMAQRCGLNHRGCKIIADWPPNPLDDLPVAAGDLLEVEGQTYSIRCVNEHPGCYLELYVDEV